MEETFRSGANIYITKPSDFNTLKQVLEKAVMAAYQYELVGMKKENFLLKI
jgi:CheY-like chemotaxis protein